MVSIGKATASASVVPAIIGSCLKEDSVETGADSGKIITLDLTATKNTPLGSIGGAVKIPDPNDSSRPIIVSRISSGDVAAFSSRCTHKGCEVPVPSDNRIVCPCHGATFNGSGGLISGPAKSGLIRYPATLEGTIVTIEV
jgi:cytochrome b6-f complex iron-sulfur subunit